MKYLRILIATPVGFNSAKEIDPWHPSLLEIKNGFPFWYYKYCEGYKCIDRIIILVQRSKYLRSGGN